MKLLLTITLITTSLTLHAQKKDTTWTLTVEDSTVKNAILQRIIGAHSVLNSRTASNEDYARESKSLSELFSFLQQVFVKSQEKVPVKASNGAKEGGKP